MKIPSLITIFSTSLLVLLASRPHAAAYYDPGLQRWINRDPIAERGGINLHCFVLNEPVNGYDVDGRVLGRPLLPRRGRASCVFWDAARRDPNKCTAAYATAAAVVCRLAGESQWEQCQRACLQWSYSTFGENCCSAASTARFVAKTAARYALCAAACAIDAGPPTRVHFPPPL